MANLAASILNIGQAKATAKFQAPEQRRKIPTVMGLALQNQDFSIPDAATLRTSPLRPVQIYYKKDIAAGAGTTKAYNHTGTFGDSGYVTVTYVSHVQPFGIPLKIGANNVYTYQDVYNNEYEMAWKNLEDRHDNSGLAFLYANRMQLAKATMDPLLQSAGLTGWNETTYALEIPDNQKTLFLQKVKDAMFARNYRTELDIVADIQMGSNFMNYMNQGAGNQNNLGWQFEGVNIARSAAVLDTNYTNGSVFAMPKGLFAGLNWNEMLNRTGLPNPDMGGSIGMVGTVASPTGSGAVADVSIYTQRSDTSANTTGGSTQDFVLQTELTLTIGYVTAPLSLASDSPIMELSQMMGVS